MNACQYNFFIAVLDQALCLFKDILRSSALDTTPNVGNYAVRTIHVTSIFNLQECLCVTGKMAYFKIVNRFMRRDTVRCVPTYNLRQMSLFSLGNQKPNPVRNGHARTLRVAFSSSNSLKPAWIFPPDF